MKIKFIYLGLILTLILVFPLIVNAEWVDADKSGQESALIYSSANTNQYAVLAVDSLGRFHIAWVESVGLGGNLNYLYWNGSAWVDADGVGQESMVVGTAAPVKPSLSLDSSDRPHLAWASGALGDVNYLYWDGSAWVDADGTGQESALVYTGGQSPSLKLNSSGQPCIGFTVGLMTFGIYYLSWNGSAWVDADGTGQGEIIVFAAGSNIYPSLDLINNNPAIAWESDATPDIIYYLSWNGSAWVDADGTGQGNIAVYTDVNNSGRPSLAITATGQPSIAWHQDMDGFGSHDIYYLSWNGSAWVDADGTGQGGIDIFPDYGNAINPSLALIANNKPAIAWDDDTLSSGIYQIYYLSWDGTAWVDVDGAGQESLIVYASADSQTSTNNALALGGNNNPYLAWDSTVNGVSGIYHLEWYTPPASALPQTGSNLIGLVNRALGVF